ncbi:MAG: protein phosphatase 2C domain-containing protein [Pseudomonadota bacterium]
MLDFEFATCATQGAREYQEDMALARAVRTDAAEQRASDEDSVTVPGAPVVSGQAVGTLSEHQPRLLAVLADGMGGHAGGALASRTVCEVFFETLDASSGPLRDHLHGALVAANTAVAEKVESDPVLSGMGSTVIGVAFSDLGVDWVSVGDSPLLLYRRGEIALLNEDHSLAPELDRMAEAGLMSQEEALRDPRRHMLRSAVTGDDLELVDQSRMSLQLEAGDYVVLASDGLQTLEASEIERIISGYGGDGAAAVANALIRAVEAVRDPHQDNATVVVVRAMTGPKASGRSPARDGAIAPAVSSGSGNTADHGDAATFEAGNRS